MQPSDIPDNVAMSQLTYDLMKRMGLNVELFATDWGTLVSRRANKASTRCSIRKAKGIRRESRTTRRAFFR